jgi:monoamine oxidase
MMHSSVLQSGYIKFSPPLPVTKVETINKFGMAVLNRVMLHFPRAFWPSDTYTLGFLPNLTAAFETSTNNDADVRAWATAPLFSVAVNNAYEDRPIHSGAIMTFMIGGDSSASILSLSDQEIRARCLELLRDAFGATNVPEPTDMNITNWAGDAFAKGSYAYLRVGTDLTEAVDILTEPVNYDGRPTIYFAGEATLKGPARGTTHGAFLSGMREAAKMIEHKMVVERMEDADFASPSALETMRANGEGKMHRLAPVIDDWFIPRPASNPQFVVQA